MVKHILIFVVPWSSLWKQWPHPQWRTLWNYKNTLFIVKIPATIRINSKMTTNVFFSNTTSSKFYLKLKEYNCVKIYLVDSIKLCSKYLKFGMEADMLLNISNQRTNQPTNQPAAMEEITISVIHSWTTTRKQNVIAFKVYTYSNKFNLWK